MLPNFSMFSKDNELVKLPNISSDSFRLYAQHPVLHQILRIFQDNPMIHYPATPSLGLLQEFAFSVNPNVEDVFRIKLEV